MQDKEIANIKRLYSLRIIVVLEYYSFKIRMLKGNLYPINTYIAK